MLVQTVYNSVIRVLGNNPTLKVYIKNFFKGLRYNIGVNDLPCIMVEPVQNNDVENDMNQFKNVYFDANVIGVSYNPSQQELAIVGDLNYKGILDIENDIRAVLQSSSTLAGSVIDISMEASTFENDDIFDTKYPTRVVVVPTRILYRQEDGV